jgi:hypothetical protein
LTIVYLRRRLMMACFDELAARERPR